MKIFRAYGPPGTKSYFEANEMIMNDRDELMHVDEFPECLTSWDSDKDSSNGHIKWCS